MLTKSVNHYQLGVGTTTIPITTITTVLQEVEAFDVESGTGGDTDVIDEKKVAAVTVMIVMVMAIILISIAVAAIVAATIVGHCLLVHNGDYGRSPQQRARHFRFVSRNSRMAKKIRFLPLCDHSFHMDCILPGLERQGCCPLCKCPVAAMLNADNSIPTVDSNSSILGAMATTPTTSAVIITWNSRVYESTR